MSKDTGTIAQAERRQENIQYQLQMEHDPPDILILDN